ncbi:hypothetical protein C8R44DRAFT_735839 [Mycena epipterygia]|nr:hypothetical protein C8R44DRAFT_735839 [Mycena epipterygia]
MWGLPPINTGMSQPAEGGPQKFTWDIPQRLGNPICVTSHRGGWGPSHPQKKKSLRTPAYILGHASWLHGCTSVMHQAMQHAYPPGYSKYPRFTVVIEKNSSGLDLLIYASFQSEWELAGNCRSSATRGSQLSRSVQGNILEARAGPLWRVGGQICAGDLSCWETALTEAELNRRGGHNFSGSTISVIHSQESDPVFGDPMRSFVTLEARRTELFQACQQTEGIDSNENSADAAMEQSEMRDHLRALRASSTLDEHAIPCSARPGTRITEKPPKNYPPTGDTKICGLAGTKTSLLKWTVNLTDFKFLQLIIPSENPLCRNLPTSVRSWLISARVPGPESPLEASKSVLRIVIRATYPPRNWMTAARVYGDIGAASEPRSTSPVIATIDSYSRPPPLHQIRGGMAAAVTATASATNQEN